MEEIDRLFVSLGLKSSLSGDVTTAVRDLNHLEIEAEKTTNKIVEDFEKVGESMKQMGKNLSLWVTAPLMAFGALSVNAAGDAAETQSKFEQVFGSMSGDVEMWADTFGDAVGRATTDLQEMLATSGSIVKAMGLVGDEGAEFSEILTQLAVDMGSFHNSSDMEAFTALRSAITGEYEAMKRFGVVVNQAKVNQELLNMGIKGGVKEATDAQKAQARLNILLRATADAQGDAERTAESYSNQVKAVQSDLQEFGETIGSDLLPIAQSGIGVVRQLIDGFERLDDSSRKILLITGGFAAALGPTIWIAGGLISSISSIKLALDAYQVSTFAATLATQGFSAALLTTPAGMVALAIGGLAASVLALTWYMGSAEDQAFDMSDAFSHSAKELQEMADEMENAEMPFHMDKALNEMPILRQLVDMWWDAGQAERDAAAENYNFAASFQYAMDAAQAELQDADQAYSDHQRKVSDLSREYDDLKSSIDRAMGFEEDFDDLGRLKEHADIALIEAQDRQKNLGPNATPLERRKADLAVRDAKDRVDDLDKRIGDLEVEQTKFTGGLDLDVAIDQANEDLKEIEKQKDDETTLMNAALKTRDELQIVYDELKKEKDELAGGQDLKDSWVSLKEYVEGNPVFGKIGLDMDWFNAQLREANITPLNSTPFASGGITSKLTVAPEAIVPLRQNNSNVTNRGDTLSIGPITVNSGQDLDTLCDEIFRRWEEMQRSKRIQMGVRG